MVYTLIILVCCAIIAYRVNMLYRLSNYKGMRYFRNSFIFFFLAFLFRYIWKLDISLIHNYALFFFIYTISMAGFYLAYSLVWKNFEKYKIQKEIMLHGIAVIIAVSDLYLGRMYFMFITQFAVLSYAIIISYSNYKQSGTAMSQLYFITLSLALIGYIVNFLNNIIAPLFQIFTYYVYAITAGMFVLFLFIVSR